MHAFLTPTNFYLSGSFHALMNRGANLLASDRVLEMAIKCDNTDLQNQLVELAGDVERGYISDLGWNLDPMILLYREIFKILCDELEAVPTFSAEYNFVRGFLQHRYQFVETSAGHLKIEKSDEIQGWKVSLRDCGDWTKEVNAANKRLKDLWDTISKIPQD